MVPNMYLNSNIITINIIIIIIILISKFFCLFKNILIYLVGVYIIKICN